MHNNSTQYLQIQGFNQNLDITSLNEVLKLEKQLNKYLKQIKKLPMKTPSEETIKKILEFAKSD